MTVLNNFRGAQGAEFRHGNRNGCLKGTRGAVLDEIELWTGDFNKPPVYWLNGLAGMGKTTIAQTIAERTFAGGWLGASFFCSRDFEDRSNLHFIFPTLAVQLARNYAQFRSLLVPLVQSDPGVAHESLQDQMRKLIVQPLKKSNISTVILIDALDECKDDEPASAFLAVLAQFASEIPKIKFFVTGRPEPRIREGFRHLLFADATDVFILHGVEPSQVENDIRLFFRRKFLELVRRRRGLDDWPTEEQLDALCQRAAGLFVYAVATVKFIDKQSSNPRKQLDLLLQSPGSSVREAKTKFRENATLDSLYTSILQGAFGDVDDLDNDPKVRSVLGAMVLAANPLSPSTIAMLLGLDAEDVLPLLSSAQSLLIFQEDTDFPVQPFHKSFPDFLIDPNRCTDQRFQVSPPDQHPQLLMGCLDLMDRMLERNMCKLPDGVKNSDVTDLEERTKKYIDPALQYACSSWHKHLFGGWAASTDTRKIASTLRLFLEKKLLFWLEVLSVLGKVRNAVDALQATANWLEVCLNFIVNLLHRSSNLTQESPTLELVNDCSRFVTGYSEIISASSQHIYHSALVFTPTTSILRKLYESHARPFARVVHGIPESWDPNAASATRSFTIGQAAWSSCGRFIAISPDDVAGDATAVEILDSATLQRLQSLEFPSDIAGYPQALIFSPDGQILTCSVCRGYWDREVAVISWDLQTGGVVSAIKRQGPEAPATGNHCITSSSNGTMVAVLYRYRTAATISIYDVVSGVHLHDVDRGVYTDPNSQVGLRLYDVWTHGESIRFAAAHPTTVTIWEVGFAPEATPTKVETLPIPHDVSNTTALEMDVPDPMTHAQFLPALGRLALVHSRLVGGALVWDTQSSKALLRRKDHNFYPAMSFSSNGYFFACSTTGSEVYLWKESSTGYVLHGKLTSSTQYPRPLLSPNGKSIVTFGGSTIQLWRTRNFTATSPSPWDSRTWDAGSFALEFIPDGPLAVVARRGGKTVTVLDLKSDIPRLTIDTGVKVFGLRVVENTIVVIGEEKVITWILPGENLVPRSRMNVEDSNQTMVFKRYREDDAVSASIPPDFRYVALLEAHYLCIYDISSGSRIAIYPMGWGALWVSPDGHKIYLATNWDKVMMAKFEDLTLSSREPVDTEHLPLECPWRSSRGYEATNDGWILDSDGKRLLMLPPALQSRMPGRVWNGQFFALLNSTLPEPVILDFDS